MSDTERARQVRMRVDEALDAILTSMFQGLEERKARKTLRLLLETRSKLFAAGHAATGGELPPNVVRLRGPPRAELSDRARRGHQIISLAETLDGALRRLQGRTLQKSIE